MKIWKYFDRLFVRLLEELHYLNSYFGLKSSVFSEIKFGACSDL